MTLQMQSTQQFVVSSLDGMVSQCEQLLAETKFSRLVLSHSSLPNWNLSEVLLQCMIYGQLQRDSKLPTSSWCLADSWNNVE